MPRYRDGGQHFRYGFGILHSWRRSQGEILCQASSVARCLRVELGSSGRREVIFLCGFSPAVDHRAGLSANRGVGKEPVLPAYDKRLYAALGAVVGKRQPAVLHIGPLLPQNRNSVL